MEDMLQWGRRRSLRITVGERPPHGPFIRNGLIEAEVYPGFRVSVDPVILREVPKPGDRITVRIFRINKDGYYGMMVDH
ncbi:hypothetical protein [Alicyclobacillus macrosporangiidus]|uniref:hypothetical protein n=1 Tax=Alicyclobacillus macrosporangiidus TaxID=392015 RepID=UPI0026EB449F|nr:hypothetical protein [Alicyclobacillus macrosporangiidus]